MYPEALQRIITYLAHFPGVGRRSAERMAIALMGWKESDVRQFGNALASLRSDVGLCPRCGNYTDGGALCHICADAGRDQGTICVVEQVQQIYTIEKSGSYHGLYHVLGGKISPMNGIGPDKLRIEELRQRVNVEPVHELVLALSPDVEGEATSNYLAAALASGELTISRIAAGVPVGADLAFADAATLGTAISARHTLNK